MERRNFIRLLIGLGIGIPILVEVATFFGLIERHLFTSRKPKKQTPASSTPTREPVQVGDELLPETPLHEILRSASIEAQEREWILTLGVEVENPTETQYEFRLGSVTLTNQDQIEGGGTTGPIPSFETRSMLGEWKLPEGSTPDRVDVTEIEVADDDSPRETTATIPLAKIPVTST